MVSRNQRIRPAFNWRKLGRITIAASLLSLAISSLGAIGYLGNKLFTVQNIRTPHADARLRKIILSKISQPLDFIHSRPATVRHHLLAALPDLAEVRVARRLPDTLIISVRKRQPIALWAKAGEIYLVDTGGEPYRQLQSSEELDLPLLRMPEELLVESSMLIAALAKKAEPGLQHLSECIGGDMGWQLYFDGGQRWLLPRNRKTEQVIDRLSRLMSASRWRTGRWWVDARFTQRWFIRRSQRGGII